MDSRVARVADGQGLSLASRHALDPCGLGGPPTTFEIFQVPYVVDLDRLMCAAKLTLVCQEPFHQLCSIIPNGCRLVVEDCRSAVSQRNAAPLCHQWLLPTISLDLHFKALVPSMPCLKCGAVAPVDLVNADLELPRQRLGYRLLHDPLQAIQPVEVGCQLEVLCSASELLLVLSHDAEGSIVDSFRQVDRLATFHVGSTLVEDEVRRKTEADPPIDRARAASPQASGVILEDRNLVTEESCDLGSCMRNQGLCSGTR